MATLTLETEALLTPSGQTQVIPADKIQHRIEQRVGVEGRTVEVKGYIARVAVASLDLPAKILFGAISDPRLRVTKALPLEVSRTNGSVVVSCPDLEEFGYGPTLSDALDDFGKTVLELYYSLEHEREKLGPELSRIREILHKYLSPRRTSE